MVLQDFVYQVVDSCMQDSTSLPHELQAASYQLQATSYKLYRLQAKTTSHRIRVTSLEDARCKLEATRFTSHKQPFCLEQADHGGAAQVGVGKVRA